MLASRSKRLMVAAFGEIVLDRLTYNTTVSNSTATSAICVDESLYEKQIISSPDGHGLIISGSPANVARGVSRIMPKVTTNIDSVSAFIGCIGTAFEQEIRDSLEMDNVDLTGLISKAESNSRNTGTTPVNTRVGNIQFAVKASAPYYEPEPDFAHFEGNADTQLLWSDINIQSLVDESRSFHFGGLALIAEPTFNTLQQALDYVQSQRSVLTSFDFSVRDAIWQQMYDEQYWSILRTRTQNALGRVHVAKLTERELLSFVPFEPRGTGRTTNTVMVSRSEHKNNLKRVSEWDRLQSIVKRLVYLNHLYPTVRLMVVTCGPAGCVWLRAKSERGQYDYNFVRQEHKSLPEGDSLAAGDAFVAAMLVGILNRIDSPDDIARLHAWQLDKLFDVANEAGALCASIRGPYLPSLQDFKAITGVPHPLPTLLYQSLFMDQ